MQLKNLTPFQPLQFDSRDENQKNFGVVVLKGTFDLRDGARLQLSPEQEPIRYVTEHYGDPANTSIRFENDIAPFKPKTDVLVSANALSPSGRPQESWDVAVQFGDVSKSLTVTGARTWTRKMMGMRLSEIEPVDSVELKYENSFGGTYTKNEQQIRFEANPVGTGFVDIEMPPDVVKAPQIFPTSQVDPEWGSGDCAGLGPLSPGWEQRSAKAGTYDVVWEKTRWPDLPADFNFEFYNSASDGLVLPQFANGTEIVKLQNLHPTRNLTFGLPGFQLATLIRFQNGNMVPGPVFLDSVHIDALNDKVYLSWRGVFPVDVPVRVVELRIKSLFQNNKGNSQNGNPKVTNRKDRLQEVN